LGKKLSVMYIPWGNEGGEEKGEGSQKEKKNGRDGNIISLPTPKRQGGEIDINEIGKKKE